MLNLSKIDYLINTRKADAKALLNKKRYSACVYLIGYAVELALKRRLCINFNFLNGFPESKSELNAYGAYPFNIKEIKTHELDILMFYSGRETVIKASLLNELNNVRSWDAEHRYQKRVLRKQKAEIFISSAGKIIKALT